MIANDIDQVICWINITNDKGLKGLAFSIILVDEKGQSKSETSSSTSDNPWPNGMKMKHVLDQSGDAINAGLAVVGINMAPSTGTPIRYVSAQLEVAGYTDSKGKKFGKAPEPFKFKMP